MNQEDSVQQVLEKSAARMFAKIGDGRWYAIPPALAESFRRAGANVLSAAELPSHREGPDHVGLLGQDSLTNEFVPITCDGESHLPPKS